MEDTLEDLEIARRLRKEHVLLQEISANLKEAMQNLPSSNRDPWLTNLKNRYEHFRAHMYKRLALEEIGGFLKVVEERRPTLGPQIEHLKQEHQKILSLIESVQADLPQADMHDSALLEDCVLRIRHILSEVEHHEEHEGMLVEFVFSQDLGGED